MAEPDIFAIADAHRRALLASERAAASAMVQSYGVAWQHVQQRLDALNKQIEDAHAAGKVVDEVWLLQQQHLQLLLPQVEAEINRFAGVAEPLILQEQHAAVSAAQAHMEELVKAQMGPPPPGVIARFSRLPTDAFTDLVGFLQDGSPLHELLAELGPDAAKAARDGLIAGLAAGLGPRQIARQIRQSLGGNMARALRISRTEVLRSYRESSRRLMQANKDVLKGWIWHSALGRRTCASCYAMHGTFHTLDERLDEHVNGRCAMVPVTKSWAELGYEGVPETTLQVESGVDAFAALTDADKAAILGPGKFQAFKDGRIDLQDLVQQRGHGRWGSMRSEASLKDALSSHGEPKPWAQYGPPRPPRPPDDVPAWLQALADRTSTHMTPLNQSGIFDAYNQEWASKMTPDERASFQTLYNWTGNKVTCAEYRNIADLLLKNPALKTAKTEEPRRLLNLMRHSPELDQPLYRGVSVRERPDWFLAKYKPGQTIDVPLGSASYDRDIAGSFANIKTQPAIPGMPYQPKAAAPGELRVLYEIESGARGVPVGALSEWAHEQEVIISGRFEVVDVIREDAQTARIVLRQAGIFQEL